MTTLFAAAVLVGALGWAPVSSAQAPIPDNKEEAAMFYLVQMAPEVCEWNNAGDASKLDAKIEEIEKKFSITNDERTRFKAMAEAELRKPGNCDANGLARALYDEAIK